MVELFSLRNNPFECNRLFHIWNNIRESRPAAAFVAVIRKGSLTAAAAELRMPKSSLSRLLTALEQDLGTPLLLRRSRRLSLTEAGEAFLLHADRSVAAADDARLAVER